MVGLQVGVRHRLRVWCDRETRAGWAGRRLIVARHRATLRNPQIDCECNRRRRPLTGGRRAVVPSSWWYANYQPHSTFWSLPVLRRARRDRDPQRDGLWGTRDRFPDRPLAVDDLTGAQAQCSDSRGPSRVSGLYRTVACRAPDQAAQGRQACCKRRASRIRPRAPRRDGRRARRSAHPRSPRSLARPATWSPKRPALGHVVESGEDLEPSARRLPL